MENVLLPALLHTLYHQRTIPIIVLPATLTVPLVWGQETPSVVYVRKALFTLSVAVFLTVLLDTQLAWI